MFRSCIFGTVCAVFLGTPLMAADRAAIVFDGSGSMWGQIDGRTKIEIARDAMSEVLTTLPEDLELGLLAYGHREKGKCSDIELIVPPGLGTAGDILSAATKINPKGKTPLSAAVRQAADTLKFTEDKATVVLVTDGIETCNADPCALGQELAKLGVNFTAHVIGFGLSEEEGRQVACLAENTGGLYIQASNASELSSALTATVEPIANPAPETPAEDPEPLPEASLEAPSEVSIGAQIDISWEGPGERYDLIQLFDPQALGGEGKRLRSKSVLSGDPDDNQVTMAVVSEPGDYELRYYSGTARDVLASVPITVTPADVALFAPDQIAMARPVTVEWIGPGGRYDSVQLIKPGGTKPLHEKRLQNDDYENRKATLPTPAETGTYELRYYAGEDRTVLATRPLEIIDAPISLTAAEAAEAGRPITIDWTGPGARYDSVQLVDPATNKVLHEKRLRNDDFDNQQATVPGPVEAGTYELRYYNGDNRAVLASVPIEVMALQVGLEAPSEIGQGKRLTVVWEGPGARYDSVQIYDPAARGGEGRVIHEKRLQNDDFDNNKASLATPVKPGPYELRYYNGDNRQVLFTQPLIIVPINIGFDAPESVETQTRFQVTWSGPGARYDSVQLFDPQARGGEGKVVFERRLSSGDLDAKTVEVVAPNDAGAFELRYYNGENRAVLHSQPLTVQ
ncbi:Ca-activated chloride channel family protein [Roseibium hamelinense]|uniref:Ca-activated chloride channel family protein n=1 Tax=Roseibium hamelinense TaxID=150831 RepID=A0A562T1T0_9HYPH|nr:VWA domain-containing protein [Roseibium hamelinense]MTI42923.1 VWA domain-containing protein [Roseibium hamelinense]TWI87641.1 Ca-activated chloride channel family protein [Roseibium hamelinense]